MKVAAAAMLLVAGLLVLGLPYALDARLSLLTHGNRELVDSARELIAGDESPGKEEPSQDSADGAAELYADALPALRDYNESLLLEGQAINDPFAGGAGAKMIAELASLDGIIGSVYVPAMGCDLALYYGASYEHLSVGAAVVSGTSVPLGEATSNCVIAAHRGWSGASMFRNIEDVRIGDELILRTPWDVLVYKAVETRVISPSDSGAVAIQEGRDMVTLVTCHPYGSNYQRYVVYFERTAPDGTVGSAGREGPTALIAMTEALDPTKSTFPENALRAAGCVLLIFSATLLVVPTRRRRGRGRHSR